MKRVWPSSFPVLAFTLVIGVAVAVRADKDPNNKGKKDPSGSYTATVGGYFKGDGNATASGNKISITANVTDENGKQGTFEAKDLSVDNTNHFSGSGTAMGFTLKLSGRVDAGGQDSAIKTKRFVCTFTTSKDSQNEEHHGRVVGYVDLTSPTITSGTDGGVTGGGGGGNGGSPGGPGPGNGPGGGGDDGGNGNGGDGGTPPPSKGGGNGSNGTGGGVGNHGGNHHHQPHRGGGRDR